MLFQFKQLLSITEEYFLQLRLPCASVEVHSIFCGLVGTHTTYSSSSGNTLWQKTVIVRCCSVRFLAKL